ncbi:MAG: CDP-alcohol phosphatidyltransferase family protein [Alphaproteobacteria bacterium]|nr:CDP-alcohol phosphatidyltransferase family protein [Alphaproteobacteria bacterium]
MLDAALRPWIDPPLAVAARQAIRLGLTADGATALGFVIGIGAVPFIAAEHYGPAAGLILLSRFFDGLDGAIARQTRITDRGGFLDISLDFIGYALIVFAFALARPDANALAAAFLLFSFMGTGATFLAFAVVATKRGVTSDLRGAKSFYYLGGLTEGTETIAAFLLACALPDAFPWIAIVFGVMCLVTTGTRLAMGWTLFADPAARDHE